ncbi:hypothetical protein ACFRU3_42810 [Streptomyces sp. NPDC056910]|uniref:hypothetical protein n=1 Tax=Streptomyces sp. NPDC056910 TaxID=3345964 RepID=UPI0036C7897B
MTAHRGEDAAVWNDLFTRDLRPIPLRLEQFHRNAQPSDVWQLLVDLHNVDAVPRGDGLWAVSKLLTEDTTVLPPPYGRATED